MSVLQYTACTSMPAAQLRTTIDQMIQQIASQFSNVGRISGAWVSPTQNRISATGLASSMNGTVQIQEQSGYSTATVQINVPAAADAMGYTQRARNSIEGAIRQLPAPPASSPCRGQAMVTAPAQAPASTTTTQPQPGAPSVPVTQQPATTTTTTPMTPEEYARRQEISNQLFGGFMDMVGNFFGDQGMQVAQQEGQKAIQGGYSPTQVSPATTQQQQVTSAKLSAGYVETPPPVTVPPPGVPEPPVSPQPLGVPMWLWVVMGVAGAAVVGGGLYLIATREQ